jgi:hypothetical protein
MAATKNMNKLYRPHWYVRDRIADVHANNLFSDFIDIVKSLNLWKVKIPAHTVYLAFKRCCTKMGM